MAEWIALGLTALMALASIISSSAVMRYRVDRTESDDKVIGDRLEELGTDIQERFEKVQERFESISNELSKMLMEFKVITAEQAVMHKVTGMAVESLTRKVEQHDKILVEHAASFALLNEVLRRVPRVNIDGNEG